MTCALTQEQLENLYRVVYTEMALARNNKKPFDATGFISHLYRKILDKSGDPTRAATFVQMVPEFILSAMTMNNLWKHLSDTGFDANQIMKMASDFRDEKNGFQAIAELVSPKINAREAEQAIIADQNTKQQVQPEVTDVPEEEESAKPSNPWTTTGQEARFWDDKSQPNEFAARNEIDQEKSFHNNVIRSVGQAVREVDGDSSKARIGNHVGFKLQLVPASEFPFENLYKETQLWLKGPKGDMTKHNQGVLAVLSDNNGQWLYFDKDGQVTDKQNGKPVYSFIRVPRNKDGNITFLKRNSEEQLLTPREILAKEQKNAIRNETPYTEEFSKKRLEELVQERKEKTDFIQKVREYLNSDKSRRVTLDITGGTLGVVTSKWEKIGRFVTDEDLRSITLDKSLSGAGGGRYTIRLRNVATPIPIDRPQITSELAGKIASVLSQPLKVEGELMSNSAKVDYVKQFLQNGNKYSNNFTISYNTDDGSIFLSVAGVKMNVPSPEVLKDMKSKNPEGLQKVYKVIYDKLLSVEGKKSSRNPMGLYPSRLSINDDLVSRGIYVDYTIDGDKAIPETKNYYDFLREGAQIGVAGTDQMDVTQLNAYLHFAPSEETLDQVYGREKAEPAKGIETPSPDPHDDDINSNLIDGLLKARGMENAATAQEISRAKSWYESNPISAHIPFRAMFNIINSDAFARWTTSGITLYNGANYTDLYHESWHGFSQLFLTRQQKKDLYNEARNLEGIITNPDGSKVSFSNATDFQIEEHLAEDFRRYVMSKGKKSPKSPIRKNIFRKILDFLKEFFFGINTKEMITQPDSIGKIHELYDKLFYGQLNSYLPSIDNVQFSSLNKGVEPVADKEEHGPQEKPLSLEESRLLVDSIDSLISEAINLVNKHRSNATATTEILTEKDKLSKLYNNIKQNFERRRDKFMTEASQETDEFIRGQKLENVRLLDYAIRNYGDPSKVLSGGQDKGLVAYHQTKTKFLGVSQHVYDVTDEATSDEDVINKGMRRNDRSGNELSLKELANDETLYLIRSLHRIEGGGPVNNRLGIPELVDFDRTWNKIVRTLEGSMTPEEMYSKLQAAQSIFPEFAQLVQKLADPHRTDLSGPEFDMNTRFWQDFNKPRVPLVQMILDKSVTENQDGTEVATYDMRIGQASADYFKVVQGWKNRFRTDSPTINRFIRQDAQRHNYLNVSAVLKEFADPRGALKEGREYDFLRAIGFYFDTDNPTMRDALRTTRSVYGLGYIFNAIKAVAASLQLPNKPTKEQQAAHTAAHAFILDPLDGLRKPQPELGFESNAGRVKALAEFHAKYSDDYHDFGVVNAENNKQYEHTLNNTLTVTLNSINKAGSYQELVDPLVDTDNNFRHMRWLNIDRNPFAKASVWLNSIFDLERFKTDGTPNPEFGKKRAASTEAGSGPVQVRLENLSGVQIVINGLYPETGIATSRSDRTTKFLSDFHMMLLTGRVELMRHASKSSSYDVVVDNIRTDPSKKDNNLYVDTSKFISPKGSDNYDGFGYAFRIVQNYVEAELTRIKMINADLPYYKTVAGYNRSVGNGLIAGQVFTVFDDVFSEQLKNKLYALKENFTAEIAKAENEDLRNQVKSEMKGYFDRLTSQNESIINEAGTKYIHQKVYDKIRGGVKSLSNEQVEKAAMRSFTYNSWIHNFESMAAIYGDLAQYNHAKEEFHKRNAGTGSTGYMYRADKAAQAHITNTVGRKYAESIGVPSRGYNGTFSTAVLKDSTVTSIYEKEYRDAFTKYYHDILENRDDLTLAQKNQLAREKIDSAMAAYTDMKEGDGQGWVTFDSYRIMKKLEGKWDDTLQEKLYNDIVAGKDVPSEQVHKFFPAYKIQYYGPLETRGLPVMAFHKFSLFPMIPSVIKGTNMEVTHNMMTRQGIDYALFESGSKLGSLSENGKPDALYQDNEQRTINEGLLFTKNVIYANYLKDQLDIHSEFKGKVIFSTQLRKLIEDGLFEYGLPIDFLVGAPAERRISDWSKLNEEYRLKASPLYGLAKRYENNIQELSELKKQELLEEAGWTEDENGNPQGDLKNLLEVVRKNLSLQDIADHQLDFLDTDDNGNLKWDLSLHLNAEKLEKLLTAMVNNRLVRQKVKGESLVQVSSSLLEKAGGSRFSNPTEDDLRKYRGTNDLPTYHKTASGKTSAMKVKIALQGDWLNLLKLNHLDDQPIATRERLNESIRNEEWLNKDQNRKAVSMVGVRIPVQGLNSMEFMEIYEFLPAEAGNIIVPPSEIVAKSGADFDIDKLTVFMTAIGQSGEFLTRGQYRKGTEEIDEEIQKLRDKYTPLKEQALKSLQIAKESRDLSRDFMKKELPKIQEALAVAKEERAHLLDMIKSVLTQIQGASRVPAALADTANISEQEMLKALYSLHSRGDLKRIDPRIDKYYSEIRKLKTERMQKLYEEKELQMQSFKEYQEEVKNSRQKADEKLEPFRKRLNHLRELKKRYASTVENEIIEDIRAILEHPSNYISLIRPNGTDIVRPVADDSKDGLAQYVQDFNPRDNYITPAPKKGVSPTRILETPYNLYKHESNNIGKRTLGIGAVENTYNTIFNRIGAYMNDSYTYSSRAGKQERRIDLLLPHNFISSDTGRKKISLANIYDVKGENKISDVISQLINGWVDIEKDAWIFFVQGNTEITPTLLFLVKSGVPFKQAAWFVSQPLVREYVREQRLARSTFSGPMGKSPSNPMFYRSKAKSEVLMKYFGRSFKPAELYNETVAMTTNVFNNQITEPAIEKIVKEKDVTSPQAKAAFLHFLEIEEMMKGIANLKFKTNFDTRRSTTLFDAVNRIAEIETLRNESRLPSELIDKVLEESVIGSFFVQDFQLKLWGKLFTLRNNPVITDYLKSLLKDPMMKQTIEDTFGDDSEKFVSEFKNDLVQFIFQNALRDFNLGKDPVYKGYMVDSDVPVQYVEKLNFGAFVKKNGEDKPVIYVDANQLRNEWATKAFVANSDSKDNYKSRQLATLPAKAFMWRGADSEKEYYKFVIEREYLRSIIPFARFEKTQEFKDNYTRNFSVLQQSKTPEESQEHFASRVSRATYEQMLRNKALENTFNPWKLFQSDTSMPLQFLQMVQQYPQLEKEYSFVSQLAVVTDQKLEMSNLTLKDRDLTADKVNRYYENLEKLSNPAVRKVPDPEENMRISMFFAKLPLFAFMQSGLSKNPNSFTQVVPYESFIKVMEQPVKDFVSNVLEGDKAVNVLNTFTSMFVRQNNRSNRKMRTKFKNYLLNDTPVEMRADYDPEEENQDRTTGDLRPLLKEGMYTYKNTSRKTNLTKSGPVMEEVPKKTPDYRAMLKANPDVLFVFSDNEHSRQNPDIRTQGPTDMRSMGNAFGILTSLRAKQSFKDASPEIISVMKNKIEHDIQQLMDMRDQGQDIAFSQDGIGSRTQMPEELFLYLSERLYQEFRYVNPGSMDLPSVRKIIGQEQGITDQEVEDFMRQCFEK